MSDNNSVFITGIAKGAIEDALDSLPEWANQKTAASIEGILLKTLNLQTDTLTKLVKNGGKDGSKSDSKKLKTALDSLSDDITTTLGIRTKENKETEEQHKKDKKYWDSEKTAREKSLAFTELIATIGTRLGEIYAENIATYDSLNAAGIDVLSGMAASRDGFESLRDITALTGVRFAELSASKTKYSSAVNSFGVGKFAKTVGMASAGMAQFGFSSKESAEALGQMLSIQQNTSDVSNKTSEQTAKDLQHFGNSVFNLSLAMGIDRTKLIEHAMALSASVEANVLSGQIGKEAAGDMTTFLASFKDQNLAKQLLKLLSDPIKPLNESFQNLQKVGMGGFANSLANFMKSMNTMPAENRAMALKNFVAAHRQDLENQKQRLAMLAQSGSAEARASLEQITAMTQEADAIKDVSDADIKRQKESNEASKKFADALMKVESLLYRAFGPTTAILKVATFGLTLFGWAIGAVISVIDLLSSSIGGVSHAILSTLIAMLHPIDTLSAAFTMISDGMKSAWKSISDTFDTAAHAIMHPIDTLSAAFTDFADIIKSSITPLLHPLDSLEAGLTSLDEVVSGGIDLTAWLGVAAIGVMLYASFKMFLKKFSILSGAKNILANKAAGVAEKTGTSGMIDGVGKGLSGLSKGFADVLKNIGTGIKDFVVNAAKMLGEGISAIAKGIGAAAQSLLGGVGKGLASFFMAFANPMVLEGAAMFSGALLLIGAAIAGVTWMIGSVLPTLADGLSALSKVDGAGLVQTGTGLEKLGAGLFAFAGAILLGGVALVSGAVSLTAFGVAALLAAPGISILADSFAKMGNIKSIDNIKTLVDTVNGLSITKAAAFAALSAVGITSPDFAKNVSTGAVGITSPDFAKNVSTGTAPKASTLNSPSAVSADPNVGGKQSTAKEAQTPSSKGTERPAPGSGVETALGYQSSILQQILESTNSLISVNKSILKYAKVST